tara:strand:- start:209 stop:433 length:225 start_codon:yes stop_codon:yes gene_type:complete
VDRSPAEADTSLPLADSNLEAVVHSREAADINPAVLGINPVVVDRSLPLADTNLAAMVYSREAADIKLAVLGIN